MTENTPKQRIFKIGSTQIVADESMREKLHKSQRHLDIAVRESSQTHDNTTKFSSEQTED
jgi:hypothetical protein